MCPLGTTAALTTRAIIAVQQFPNHTRLQAHACTCMYVLCMYTGNTGHTWTRADFVDLKGVYDITWIHTELTHKPFALADLVG